MWALVPPRSDFALPPQKNGLKGEARIRSKNSFKSLFSVKILKGYIGINISFIMKEQSLS